MSNDDNFVEPANHPAAQQLTRVRVGQLVWVDYRHPHWDAKHETEHRLTEITHIDKKGRLYFCVADHELINNFRYGFDPLTGVSPYKNYEGYTMRFASIESIEAERERIATEKAENEAAEVNAACLAKVRNAAPTLLKAVIAAHTTLMSMAPTRSGEYARKESTIAILDAAIAEATL
jgi:hypothetical protein